MDADELLRMTPSYGASRYCLVHEENIAGSTPFAQIAIEYEIEQQAPALWFIVCGPMPGNIRPRHSLEPELCDRAHRPG